MATVTVTVDGTEAQTTLTLVSPTPVARFSRTTYNNTGLPPVAGRYALLDMQAGTPSPATSAISQTKKTDPALRVLTYVAPECIDTSSNAGVTRLPANGTTAALGSGPYAESCFLHDPSGNRVQSGAMVYMNTGDPAWQQTVAQFCADQIARVGSDGIYLDEIATAGVWQQGLPAGILTDPQLQANHAALIAAIKAKIAPKLLIVNIGGGAVVGTVGGGHVDGRPVWQRYLQAGADGAEEESWCVGTDGQPLKIANQWLYSLQNVAWCEANGKWAICNGDDKGSTILAQYGLGSMLLVAQGLSTFCVSRGVYFGPEVWLPVYDQARALIAPIDPPQLTPQPDGLYRRRFTTATGTSTVTVDPVGHTAMLG